MTKKIGILTFHFVDNYGALLQAYALCQYIKSLGHHVEFIDYQPEHVVNGGNFSFPTNLRKLRANLAVAYFKMRRILALMRGNKNQECLFLDFKLRFLPITQVKYKSLKELQRNPPDKDVYICGSDQIWNASKQFGLDPAYFLNFGDETVKRISYAASFGRANLDSKERQISASLLQKLDQVSVRESSAVNIVHEMIGRQPAHVPDPTLLLDDYAEVAVSPTKSDRYIFSYALRTADIITDVHNHVARQMNISSVVPWNSATKGCVDGLTATCGPAEWLGYLKNSDVVITNSFHGTVFSILFRKPFLTVGLPRSKSAFNERSASLLKRLGLSHRMVMDYNPQNINHLLGEKIDWDTVMKELTIWRLEAKNFVHLALQ